MTPNSSLLRPLRRLLAVVLLAVAACSPNDGPLPSDAGGGDPGADGGGQGEPGRLFAPYIDMGLATSQDLLAIQQRSGVKVFTLAFVIDDGSCRAVWGGLGTTVERDLLPNGQTVASLVEGVRAAGGDVIVSFGGANGTDLSPACTSAAQVQAMYQSVIDKYHLRMVDFDIEGYQPSSQPAVDLRNEAIKGLKAANPGLVVSYTLPVLPSGLVETGTGILAQVKASGLGLDVVNVMAMDYGTAADNGGQMGLSAIQAAEATLGQVREAGLEATVGVTPMIGLNDVASEIFRLSDAEMLLEFARAHPWMSRLSIWSVTRDNGACPAQAWASPVCSGLSQDEHAFSRVFSQF
jgi:hypothetical protein